MFEFDIIPLEYDLWQNIYCFAMYVVIILLFYRTNICSYNIWNKKHKTALLFILYLICTLTIFCNHDFYGYYTIVKYSTLGENSHLEAPYVSIAQHFDRNYLMFRISVWGSALTFFCIGARAARVSVYHALFVLAACFFVTFAYGRVSLAMTMCFCGYVIFYQNKKKNIAKALIGVIIFICSFFFHKSIILAMFMSVLMTLMPINKKTLWLMVILVPFLFIMARSGFTHIITTGEGLNEDTAKIALKYSAIERAKSNLFGMLGELLDYGFYYLTTFIGIKTLFIQHKQNQASPLTLNLFKISIGLIFLGICFFFFGLDNKIFAYRILYMSMIPLAYCIVKFYSEGIISQRQLRNIVCFGIANGLFYTLYMVYKQM